jgi:hypothetical protein
MVQSCNGVEARRGRGRGGRSRTICRTRGNEVEGGSCSGVRRGEESVVQQREEGEQWEQWEQLEQWEQWNGSTGGKWEERGVHQSGQSDVFWRQACGRAVAGAFGFWLLAWACSGVSFSRTRRDVLEKTHRSTQAPMILRYAHTGVPGGRTTSRNWRSRWHDARWPAPGSPGRILGGVQTACWVLRSQS